MTIEKTITMKNKTLSLSIHGVFDFSVMNDFRSTYTELKTLPKKVVLDFRYTIHIDSSALGMLLNLKEYISANRGDIKIINITNNVKKILTLAHFERLFDIA